MTCWVSVTTCGGGSGLCLALPQTVSIVVSTFGNEQVGDRAPIGVFNEYTAAYSCSPASHCNAKVFSLGAAALAGAGALQCCARRVRTRCLVANPRPCSARAGPRRRPRRAVSRPRSVWRRGCAARSRAMCGLLPLARTRASSSRHRSSRTRTTPSVTAARSPTRRSRARSSPSTRCHPG